MANDPRLRIVWRWLAVGSAVEAAAAGFAVVTRHRDASIYFLWIVGGLLLVAYLVAQCIRLYDGWREGWDEFWWRLVRPLGAFQDDPFDHWLLTIAGLAIVCFLLFSAFARFTP